MANFGTRSKRASRRLLYGGAEALGAPLRGETEGDVGRACLIDRFDSTEKCERGPVAVPNGFPRRERALGTVEALSEAKARSSECVIRSLRVRALLAARS